MSLYLCIVVLLGLVISYYWARVLHLVRKIRRKTGASAQLLPAEPLGRVLRVVWYPTVAGWIAGPFVAAGLALRQQSDFGSLPIVLRPWLVSPLLYLPATAIALLAFVATLICWKRMGSSWRMGINPGEKTSLVVTGPYAFVAHPIYGLQQLLVLASLAILPTPWMLAVAVIEVLFLNWEASREERHLVSVHGDLYANYRKQVGRFLPRSWRRAAS
jgi:protein-S-isoprenylcysteine O-methyltransferase Ste14